MMKQNGLKLSAVFILVNVTCSAVALLVLFLITSAAFQLGLLRPRPLYVGHHPGTGGVILRIAALGPGCQKGTGSLPAVQR